MSYDNTGTFTILNEIGDGYACNNQLPPLIGADLDDIATGLTGLRTGAGSIGAVQLLTGSPVAVTHLNIVFGTLINTYKKFSIVFTNLQDSSDGDLVFQASTDGGSTFDSTANAYTYFYQDIRNDGVQAHSFNNTTATSAIIGWGSSNANYASGLTLDCYNLGGTTNFKQFSSTGTLGSGTSLYSFQGGATYQGAVLPVNALQFSSDGAGNLTFTVTVYGWR
jgi:hypothetical protein